MYQGIFSTPASNKAITIRHFETWSFLEKSASAPDPRAGSYSHSVLPSLLMAAKDQGHHPLMHYYYNHAHPTLLMSKIVLW